MGRQMYQNYIFDLYGTLVDIHTDEEAPQVWEKLCLFYGYHGARYSPPELKAAYKRLVRDGEGPQYSHEAHPEIQIETVFRALFTEKGVRPGEALVLHAGQFFRILTTEYLRLYDGVPGMLEALHRMGKRVYLLSNAQRIFTAYELNVLGIAQYFDGILISSDCGVKKPDRRFFRLLLDRYRLKAEESVMIGNDCTTDIAGAAAVGLDTFYIHSNISPEYRPGVKATYTLMGMDIARVRETLAITGETSNERGNRHE